MHTAFAQSQKRSSREAPAILATALLSIGLVTASFCMQGRIGINLGDEGFLWYGVQRVLAGEVPLRDFHAYEPGRYYWDAAFALVLRSDGLLQLRIANSAFAAVGLFLALLAVRTVIRSWLMLALFGTILTLWLFPRHKLFEHGIAMAAVFTATRLIMQPTLRHHALAGTFVGFAAFFGFNHGLYTGLALGLTMIYVYLRVDRRDALRRTIFFAGGVILGLMPLLAMFIFVPGYWRAVAQSILLMFQGTQSQQALAVPWPWRMAALSAQPFQAAFDVGTSIAFLMMPALFGCVLLFAIVMRRSAVRGRALLIASGFVGVMYAHHAFSRADFAHLAQAMHPLLLCVIGLVGLSIEHRKRWLAGLITVALMAFTAATALRASPWAEYRRLPLSERATMRIDGHTFYVTAAQERMLAVLQQEVAAHVKNDESFAAAPLYPFAYPFMHARSPWWDIYHLFARDAVWQRNMIAALHDRHVTLIMLNTDVAVDGREELKFPNSNPLVWQYIQTHYVAEDPPGAGARHWHARADTATRPRVNQKLTPTGE